MRALLTSAGITNSTIRDALADLLGKPIAEAKRPLHPDCHLPLSRRGLRGIARDLR